MTQFEHLERLPHIAFEREPERKVYRPRPYGERVEPRADRRKHANRLRGETSSSVAALNQIRSEFGIVPDKLLVLRFDALKVSLRETLEQLNASVIEETKEELDGKTVFKLYVQFPNEQVLIDFTTEYDSYAEETTTRTRLTPAKRRDLFDALDSVSTVTPSDRIGRRLQKEGKPKQGTFYLDVDLWNPGSDHDYKVLLELLGEFLIQHEGQIVRDPLRIPSMILVKIKGNRQLLEKLLRLDIVSRVDLPPVPSPEDSFRWPKEIPVPNTLRSVADDGPLACLVDSGVVAGHPLLRGLVVAEEDFDSGESTPVDLDGHGTEVGGQIVYGDIARCLLNDDWEPHVRLCSAKVMRNDSELRQTKFNDAERVEDQLERAIRYFNNEYDCRVFNLSLGDSDNLYSDGKQFPKAELLDKLARELDIIIVVAAGNVATPEIPEAINSERFQEAVARNVHQPSHKLIDPSTAALCVSVGSIARREDVNMEFAPNETLLAASAQGCPSPFTRCGRGVAGAVKPEVVGPGGNLAVHSLAGSIRWRENETYLSEPSLNYSFANERLIRATLGTSVATAHVTHIAARMESTLRKELGAKPSQNLVRALLVDSARVHSNVRNFNESTDKVLNTVGYGQPNVEYCWSSRNRVTLIAEDNLEHRSFHVYSIVVPEDFIKESGKRSVSVSLAYDPPTRLSRPDYIATAMWLEIYGGLTAEQVFECRSKFEGTGSPPTVEPSNKLQFKPGLQTLKMSTVQRRLWHSNRGTVFNNRRDSNGDATLQIFVGCQPRFKCFPEEDSQRYALVVTLKHESQEIDIYQQVWARIQTRQRIRVTS